MKSNRKGVRRERREFSAEFKAEAVRLVAERRRISPNVTKHWLKPTIPVRRAHGQSNGQAPASARANTRSGYMNPRTSQYFSPWLVSTNQE